MNIVHITKCFTLNVALFGNDVIIKPKYFSTEVVSIYGSILLILPDSEFNSLTTKKQTTKFSSANFQKN